MTPDEINVTLKAVSQSIISIRRRLTDWRGSEDGKHVLERDLELLTSSRTKLEQQAA